MVDVVVVVGFKYYITPSVEQGDVVGLCIVQPVDVLNEPGIIVEIIIGGDAIVDHDVSFHVDKDFARPR